MRKWINLVESIEDQSKLSDVYMLVHEYVTHGEWTTPTQFNSTLQKIMDADPRPDRSLLLYRALRLTNEQLAEYQAGKLVLHDRIFSSWSKSIDSVHRIAQTKGSIVLILKQQFSPEHIVIDVPDFYEEHEFTRYGEYSEYHNFVRVEQEVIVHHSGEIKLTSENSEIWKAPDILPMIGDMAYYHDEDESGMEIEDVDYEQPYAGRNLYTVTLNDGHEATVRNIGPKEWEIVNLDIQEAIYENFDEDLEYDPLRFFWYNPDTGMMSFGDEDLDHATAAYERIHGKEDDFTTSAVTGWRGDEESFLWNSHQISKAISVGWVRGRYTKSDSNNNELSLQGKRRNVHRAATWFATQHPIDILYVDFAEGEHVFWDMKDGGLSRDKDTALKGNRLEFFLSKGSVPSSMVMESQQGKAFDGIVYHCSNKRFSQFRLNPKRGIYFADTPDHDYGRYVYRCRVSLANPITADSLSYLEIDRPILIEDGYDGRIVDYHQSRYSISPTPRLPELLRVWKITTGVFRRISVFVSLAVIATGADIGAHRANEGILTTFWAD